MSHFFVNQFILMHAISYLVWANVIWDRHQPIYGNSWNLKSCFSLPLGPGIQSTAPKLSANYCCHKHRWNLLDCWWCCVSPNLKNAICLKLNVMTASLICEMVGCSYLLIIYFIVTLLQVAVITAGLWTKTSDYLWLNKNMNLWKRIYSLLKCRHTS